MRVLVQKVISICVALVLLFSSAPFFVWATAPSGESCPTGLLGSGCHDMGNAWFNGDMTQYVNYGGSTAYSCSTNYLSGCSTGGTSPPPPSGETCPATLLGSGCHNMGNAWFNSEMNQYVYFGGSTVYSCSTNYITNCTTGGSTPPPPPPSGSVPSLPSSLTQSFYPGASDVKLAWNDTSSDETEFKIYYRPQGGTWTVISSVGTGITTFTEYGKAAGAYEYHVNACNANGCSYDSNWVTVTVGSTTPPPPPSETCPATLLGSGCHNMGNAWFNSEMNQYVYFGGSTVYSCSTNYITNCTSGDTGLPPPPSYGCSAEPTNLLGSGCHDMGTAWFNGEMNKYVLYNTNAVKECSKDYFSGCSSGGTTPPPPTSSCSIELINLLGSGCHDMGNAWFNGEMSKYVKYGELTVYECASNPLSSCTTGTVPPSGGFWVEGYQSYPRYGESGVSISPKVHIVFSKGVDTKTLDSGSVFLAPASSPDTKVNGTITAFTNGFDFVPLVPLSTNTVYRFGITASVKASDGAAMPGSWYVEFTTGASTEGGSGSLSGLVLGPDGKPVAGAYVSVHTPDYIISRSTESLTDGVYNIANIPAGSYELVLYPPANATNLLKPAPQAVSFKAGDVLVRNLLFSQAAKVIRGSVVRSDGRVISDAKVGAYQEGGGSWSGTQTDASGKFTLTVSGGDWKVGIYPVSYTAEWFYDQAFVAVSFAKDETPEEKTISFIVKTAGSYIKGTVLSADGTALPANTVFVEVRTDNGQGSGAPVEAGGTFSLRVSAGTYIIYVRSQDPAVDVPSIPSVVVKEGETVQLGTIMLGKRQDVIRGSVVDSVTGAGVANATVNAYMKESGGYASVRTDASGGYMLRVSPGRWFISVAPDPGLDYYSAEPPREVEVVAGTPLEVMFKLSAANATISGTVQNEQGQTATDVYGYAYVEKEDSSSFDPGGYPTNGYATGPASGGPIERGLFNFKVPAGVYRVGIFLPPDSPYVAGDRQTVTASAGKTTQVVVSVKSNDAKIVGALRDVNGNPVTNVEAFVSAYAKGSWQNASFNKALGTYELRVAAGEWRIGVRLDPNSGYSVQKGEVTVIVAKGAQASRDFTVVKADATVSGKATKPNGEPAPGAFVKIAKVSLAGGYGSPPAYNVFVAGTETASDGTYKVSVPAGTYYVNAFVPFDSGLLNPLEQEFSVSGGGVATVNLAFRSAGLMISGRVLLEDKGVANAFVWGWSEQGGFSEARTDQNGVYSLKVAAGPWRVRAGKELEGKPYKSSELQIEVIDANVVQDLVLSLFEFVLPPPEIKKIDASGAAYVETANGTALTLPGSAVATGGTVTVSITPDAEAPSQGTSQVIGVAYNIEARDTAGSLVTKLNQGATVEIPYTDDLLVQYGITEDQLKAAFWDETTDSWRELDQSAVDKTNNVVTALVDHLTRFAIIGSADSTAPEAPAGVTLSNSEAGVVLISWQNPAKDFKYAKMYRSEKKGEPGAVVYNNVTGASQKDTGLTGGVTYYYIVRAVDSAGNESPNVNQVAATVVGTPSKTSAKEVSSSTVTVLPFPPSLVSVFARSLKLGDRGEDVKKLQELLKIEGVYPEGLVTGTFGPLTQTAVARLQEKYNSEVLKPAGVLRGTGFVGSLTRLKLNALAQLRGLVEKLPSVPGLKTALRRLERNLTAGSRGDDVKTLQQLLKDEGVYPTGEITGYLGPLTKAAVMKFQEKYASEILTPNGLGAGNGFVGVATRAKINSLIE